MAGGTLDIEHDSQLEVENITQPNVPQFKCDIPLFESVQVSIIVPVYNQWEITDNCLQSIVHSVKDVSYEIILADDCSNDSTLNASNLYKHLKISRPDKNLGFLLNCKLAAKQAKGDYLVFLNNDTLVHEKWLSELFNCMEANSDVAISGSKLVYPDGSLQEAGGIVWNDGNGWNYGRNDDPGKPEYNYVKDVDYISGASIMVRTKFWTDVDGFDERFVPAYYEDTDLCFQARQKGYRVVYVPQSVVTHFEGKSHGTEETSGIKAHQIRNKEVFQEKWANVLKDQHFPSTASRIFHARDKSSGRRTILFIDHYVPWYDQDAGSRSTFMYIQYLCNSGYNVKFIGDNFFPHQPYTQSLQQLGVEVLYGNYYANNWKNWIIDHANYIDVVYLHRPHIAPKYIDLVKKHTNAKIVYQCHDLHFLRSKREYAISNEEKVLEEAHYFEKVEKELFKKADVGLTFSLVEKSAIEKWELSTKIFQVPLYLYDKSLNNSAGFEDRNDIMFVGGFNHKPNVEGVEWFISQVFPKIRESLPSVMFHIIGSKAEEFFEDLDRENIRVHGRISDTELANQYSQNKVNILPLRYGAGVKGKLIESMRFQIPIVSTSIGVEGVNADSFGIESFDTSKDFAKEVISLITNEKKWNRVQSNLKDAFEAGFTTSKIDSMIDEIF